MCVCVCDRERERETYSHLFTGLLKSVECMVRVA